MKISTKGRYSLEALLYMALHSGGEYLSTGTTAEATGISEGYLEQLFIPLRKTGIVRGIRGPKGGYTPGRELSQITVGDILRTAEGPLEPAECVSESFDENKTCPMSAECPSRGIWMELYREIKNCVDSITLADLAEAYQAMDNKAETAE